MENCDREDRGGGERDPVTSYTTQPIAACWIHWLDQDRAELVHSRR